MTPEKLSEIREMCRHDPEASARAAMMLADALEAAQARLREVEADLRATEMALDNKNGAIEGQARRAEAAEATIRRLELVPSWGARDVDPDALVLLVADFDAALRGEADRPAEVCARPGTHDWKPVYDAPLLYCGWCRATKPDPARGKGDR